MAAAATAIAALASLDALCEQVAEARRNYATATDTIIRSRTSETDQYAVASRIGLERLDELLVKRMRALGLDLMLKRARTPGRLDATVRDTLASKIADLA